MAVMISFGETLKLFNERRIGLIRDDLSENKSAVWVSAAEKVELSNIVEIINHTGGLFNVAISSARAEALMLSRMVRDDDNHADSLQFSSVEAREGVSTGISAADRLVTIRILGERIPSARKLVKPGHIFPYETRPGGVLVKNALPEAALDLVRIAGNSDAALFVDALNPQGEYLTADAQDKLCTELGITLINISDLIRHRLETEQLVTRIADAKLPTRLAGELRSYIYKSEIHDGEHLALIKGEISSDKPTLTRVQPEFTFTDVFGGANPPSRQQIDSSLNLIGKNGSGVLIYLRRPERGSLKEQVSDWQRSFEARSPAGMREYGLGAQILRDLGVRKIDLITNSKKNLVGLKPFGIEIVSQRGF